MQHAINKCQLVLDVNVSIVTETSQGAKWNRQADGQTGRQTGGQTGGQTGPRIESD